MKQVLLSLALAAAAFSPAAADKVYLNQITTNSGYDKFDFAWFEDGKIKEISAVNNTEDGDLIYRREFTYDAEGRQTTESLHMYYTNPDTFEGSWIKTGELRYIYNDKGLLDTRETYSYNLKGEETFQAITKYVYDEADMLQHDTMYFDTTMMNPYQRNAYTYDADRRVVEVTSAEININDNQFRVNQAVTYTYVDELLTEIGDYIVDTDGSRAPNSFKIFRYDAQGNLSQIDMTNSNKVVAVGRFVYSYNETPIEDVVYPQAYEAPELNIYNEYDYIRFGIESMKVYEEDIYSNTLQLFDTYNYHYGSLGTDGINAPVADRGSLFIPVVNGGNLALAGVAPFTSVSVYDMQGRVVINGKYRQGGLDINALPAGAYIVRAGSAVAKFTK